MHDFVEEAVRRLVVADMAREEYLRGASPEEILDLELRLGVVLPASYRAFLLRIGRDAGEFLGGTNYLFPDLFELRGVATSLLEETSFRLEDNDFVFAAHQGYQFLYFRADGSDDPPVYPRRQRGSNPRGA